ncbi:MAG TPA: hypothetical protein VEA17_16995, partial [Bordetella sp.]|nr:hypothetical protein [Bordetella sp.]
MKLSENICLYQNNKNGFPAAGHPLVDENRGSGDGRTRRSRHAASQTAPLAGDTFAMRSTTLAL